MEIPWVRQPRGTGERLAHVTADQWGVHLIRGWTKDDWIGQPQRVGNKVARLIGAALGEVAENLFDVGDWFQQWRFHHMKTVERPPISSAALAAPLAPPICAMPLIFISSPSFGRCEPPYR